ncbi:SGNH domain-containing protein [Frankia sp. AgKG'84/4]
MRIGRLGPIAWMFVAAVALVLGALVIDHARTGPRARIALWGDSLAWESQGSFAQTVTAEHRDSAPARVLMRTWGGTAPCDWLTDIRDQSRRWHPTVAALAFSGNQGSDCMRGRDLLSAYRQDVTAAVEQLTAAGTTVLLVEAPPRRDQPVDAAGLTPLDRLWREIAASHPRTQVAPAGRAVSADDGRFAPTLPCDRGETCGPGGMVTVRSPDGTHFCPSVEPPMTPCPVVSPGAARYGAAIAREALAAADGAAADTIPGDGDGRRIANADAGAALPAG